MSTPTTQMIHMAFCSLLMPAIGFALVIFFFRLPHDQRLFFALSPIFCAILPGQFLNRYWIVLGILAVGVVLYLKKRITFPKEFLAITNLGWIFILSHCLDLNFYPLASLLFPLSMTYAFPTIGFWPWIPIFDLFIFNLSLNKPHAFLKGSLILLFCFAWIQWLRTEKIQWKVLMGNMGIIISKLIYDCLTIYHPLPKIHRITWAFISILYYVLIYGPWRVENHLNPPMLKGVLGIFYKIALFLLAWHLIIALAY